MKLDKTLFRTIIILFLSGHYMPSLADTYIVESETTTSVNKTIVRAELGENIYAVVKCGISTGSAQQSLKSLEDIGLSLDDAPFLIKTGLKFAIKSLTLDKGDSYCIAWNVPTSKAGSKSADAERDMSNVQTWIKKSDGSLKAGPAEKPNFWCARDASPVCYEIVNTNGAEVVGLSTCIESTSNQQNSETNSVIVSLGEVPPEFKVTESNAVQSKKCSERNSIWKN